ncbi:hypothetical protein [Bathycoccus sp. RCC716 virus 1]|uniref:DUF5899 domain-containing protein n=1 Tax=Bathycoccus sp. RCC716 virus 1 TaxID=2530038 RepID=A0A7S6NXS2_9PHYC|nr:hypothetical protein [Bathycoccus sp. RCC716 virus 1]
MADPISIMAIAGLVYAGRKLSQPDEKYKIEGNPIEEPEVPSDFSTMEVTSQTEYSGPISPLVEPSYTSKQEMNSFSEIAPQQRSSGGEILTMRNRMYDTGRMNNLSPVEKQLIGPGLGVGPEVPAFGGHQQLFRVNPENVGAYRLTTLPGRSGPAFDAKGGRRGIVGEVAQNRPEKTAFLYGRLPPAPGRAQGMSGRTPRAEHERTKRTTNRSETSLRTDTLGFAGAKRTVSALTRAQEPTRNKMDGTIEHYQYNNQPAPGINSFIGGYLNAPASKIGEKRTYGSAHTAEDLMKYGFRPDDRRGKPNRAAGPGRMNVRADALNQGGMVTSVRSDTSRIDGRVNAADGAWTQRYKNNDYHKFNAYKGHENPNSSSTGLDIAKRQLANNPLVHSLS